MRHPRLALLTALTLLLSLGLARAAVIPQPGAFQGCPAQGHGGDPDLNRLKNRSVQVKAPQSMTVAQITALPMPVDILRRQRATWPLHALAEISALERTGVVVEAFLMGVKQEGPESTNCRRHALRDYHLWIVDARDHTRAQSVVAEVTPRWLGANAGWRLHTLSRLATQHAKLRLTGWLLFDPEHPDQIGKTRGGLWEIHPITKIEVFSGGTWMEL